MENIDPKMGERIFLIIWKKIKGLLNWQVREALEKGTNQPLHSSRFILDEDVLLHGPGFVYLYCMHIIRSVY